MALGEVYEATAGGSTDLYYVDTEMYDTPQYGSIYILDAERPALVDAGIGLRYETILEAMDSVGIAPDDLAVIAPTHVHLDHAGGVGYLADACPNADIYVHEQGTAHLVDPERLWAGTKKAVGGEIQFYAEPEPVPAERITAVTDGEEIALGDHSLQVHHAPGHAPHQVVFYDPANDGVFAADAAGIYTPQFDSVQPTTPPPNFDLEKALADVEMMHELDPEVLYFGHFGAFEAGDLLAEYERVVADWVADVQTAREEFADDEAVVRHFQDKSDKVEAWGERKANAEMRMNVRGVLTYLDRRGE